VGACAAGRKAEGGRGGIGFIDGKALQRKRPTTATKEKETHHKPYPSPVVVGATETGGGNGNSVGRNRRAGRVGKVPIRKTARVRGNTKNNKAVASVGRSVSGGGIQQQRGSRRIPDEAHGMTWAYGITTTPKRLRTLLPRTIRSLTEAGFDQPHLFVDGSYSTDYNQFGLAITFRSSPVHAYPHWMLTAWELYFLQPQADRFVIFQDDILAVCNLRSYLEEMPYPVKSYLNLFSFLDNERLIRNKPSGWYEAKSIRNKKGGQQRGCGALALVFSRDAMVALLGSGYMSRRMQRTSEEYRGGRDKGGMPRAYSYIDGAVVTAMNQMGWREYIHAPSLIQHTGIKSTIGTGRMPLAKTFPGEQFDAKTLLSVKTPFSSKPKQTTTVKRASSICVVIPAAGDCFSLISSCLKSLSRSIEVLPQVVLVDNGCPEKVSIGADRVAQELGLKYQRIFNKENRGFTYACNQGIAVANGADVVLLNTDCRVAPNCLSLLEQTTHQYKQVAAVGPLTFDYGNQSLRYRKRLQQAGLTELLGRPRDLDTIADYFKKRTVSVEARLAFFCVFLNHAAIEDVGPLDESSVFASGLGVDDIWCKKAKHQGWKIFCHHGAFAEHDHAATFSLLGLDRKRLQRDVVQRFRRVKRKSKVRRR